MYEEKIKEISNKFNNDYATYMIITNKKANREIYVMIDNDDAVDFIKPKFKGIMVALHKVMKSDIFKSFMRKVQLSRELGEVIYVGGQIKCFDLKNKIVKSFPHEQGDLLKFFEDKENQKVIGEMGYAPKIIDIDYDKNYSTEELYDLYDENIIFALSRLFEFYKENKFHRIPVDQFSKTVLCLNNPIFIRALDVIKKCDYLLHAQIHGEFSKEQCLQYKGKIYFVDWDLREGLLTEDLVSIFRLDNAYYNKKEFNELLKLYPDHVKKNLKYYLLATELIRITNRHMYERKFDLPVNMERIKLSEQRINNILKDL